MAMNIFVCIKQVPDTETKVRPNQEGSYIDTIGIKWIMNPYDEFAVEQALLFKATNTGSTVTVVRVGAVKDNEALRKAMAMGADEAILVEAPDSLDSYSTPRPSREQLKNLGKNQILFSVGNRPLMTTAYRFPSYWHKCSNSLPYPSSLVLTKKGRPLQSRGKLKGVPWKFTHYKHLAWSLPTKVSIHLAMPPYRESLRPRKGITAMGTCRDGSL